MNIVCVESLGISQARFEDLKSHYASMGHAFTYYMDRREDEDTLVERMHEADAAVISNIKLPAAVLSQCPKLRYLSVAFTGLDHIDLAYCKEHGIKEPVIYILTCRIGLFIDGLVKEIKSIGGMYFLNPDGVARVIWQKVYTWGSFNYPVNSRSEEI